MPTSINWIVIVMTIAGVLIGGILALSGVFLGALFVFRAKMAQLGVPFVSQVLGRKMDRKPQYYVKPEEQDETFEKVMDEAVSRIREQRMPKMSSIEDVLTGKQEM